jgi:pimeloyl-ACP methyl ester carboxylesterase
VSPGASSIIHRHEHGIFVRETGIGTAGGALVYVHGLGESGLCFEHLLCRPELRSWRQLIPDLPGYGRSPWPLRPLSLGEQADLLARWLADLPDGERRPLVVVGHSMGGVVGQMLCERHPELSAALVDVDGNVSRGDCVFSGRAAAQDLPAFVDRGFDRLRNAVYMQGRREEAQRGYYASLRLADPAAFHANSVELVELSSREGLATRLAALAGPVLYIAGVPGGACDRSRELLAAAGVRRIDIGPSGHWPFLDQADRFVSELVGFLATLPASE